MTTSSTRENWKAVHRQSRIRSKFSEEAIISVEVMCHALASFRQIYAFGSFGDTARRWQIIGWWGAWTSLWRKIAHFSQTYTVTAKHSFLEAGFVYVPYVPLIFHDVYFEYAPSIYHYHHHIGYALYFNGKMTRAKDQQKITHIMNGNDVTQSTACQREDWTMAGPMISTISPPTCIDCLVVTQGTLPA